MIQEDFNENIIVSVNEKDEVSIADVATLIAKEFDYFNMMRFDSTLPTVNAKKLPIILNFKILPNYQFTNIQEGIKKTVRWFLDNYNSKNIRL